MDVDGRRGDLVQPSLATEEGRVEWSPSEPRGNLLPFLARNNRVLIFQTQPDHT